MPKKKEELTEEEYQAVKDRMVNLRAMALEKRQEKARERKAVEADLEAEKWKEIDRKKALLEKKKIKNENLSKELEAVEAEPLSAPPPETPVKKPPPRVPFDSSSDDEYYKKIKTKIKNKIKKYQSKYTAQPQAPQPKRDIVAESARDLLNTNVRSEIQQMAFKALFPSDW